MTDIAARAASADGMRLWSGDGAVAPVLHTDFDVAAYTRDARGPIAVDAEALVADDGGLADPALRRDLAFLHRIEVHALSEVRAMYSTWTVNEARITAFIATWLYERHWMARSLRHLLEGTGEMPRPTTSRQPRLRRAYARLRGAYVDQAQPLLGPLWTALAGERITAGHMARMAMQEGSMEAAMRALRERTSGETARVLQEILERRARVVDFFVQEATARITRSEGEAITARLVHAFGGAPLRLVGVPDPDEAPALASIFRTRAARAELRAAHRRITALLPGPAPRPILPERAIDTALTA